MTNISDLRRSFDEEDIAALILDARFLVALDAYRAEHFTLAQLLGLAFSGPPYIPRNLHPMTFARLVHEIARRIREGKIEVPSEWRAKYAGFYRDLPRDPL